MRYTFEQIYFYGDNWQGGINVPESAKFYKDYTLSDDQQKLIILFFEYIKEKLVPIIKGSIKEDLVSIVKASI